MSDNNKYTYLGKYESKYDDSMPERLIKMCSQDRELHTKNTIANKLGITVGTLYKWLDPDNATFKPDLFEAYHSVMEWLKGAWEQEGIDNLYEGREDGVGASRFGIKTKFNNALYLKFMEQHHGYISQSKSSVEVSEIDPKQVKQDIDKFRKDY